MCTATSLHSHYTHRLESMPSINKSLCDILENIRQSYSAFFLDNSCLFKVMGLLDIEMEQGLCQESKATVKMLNSFVRSIPNGSESGRFLALDLGGTNFRILLIQLGELYDENNCVIAVDSFELPKTLMIGEGYVLFDHIADCLSTFISKHDLSGFKLPLGFTFSFPMYQNKLNHGVLVTWTKGFKCSGVVGQDVVMLLQDAIVRQGTIDVEIVAILNDGVGALMSSAFVDCNAAVAVIIGTGSNAAYFEKIENVKKTHFAEKQPGRVIIDTEWAAFGENGVLDFLFTHFDTLLDKLTVHPGQYVFEKMISGMYLGELTRLVLMDLIDRKIIFDAKEPGELASENSFKTDYLSAVETFLKLWNKHCL